MDTDFIYATCCTDKMRYPTEMDLYQIRPVRKTECEEGEKVISFFLLPVSQTEKHKVQVLLTVYYSGQNLLIFMILKHFPLLFH